MPTVNHAPIGSQSYPFCMRETRLPSYNTSLGLLGLPICGTFSVATWCCLQNSLAPSRRSAFTHAALLASLRFVTTHGSKLEACWQRRP